MQTLASRPSLRDRAVPKALRNAYVHSGLSMTAMAAELGLTVARVSQLVARAESLAAARDDQ
jgi:plasmid maintenance system antidote protein VapI